MRERVRPLLESLATFVTPGLVLLLLGIQVALGLRGFDRPDDGLLQVLQVPGVLLGWGGVMLLLPLLVWMILDWWGYDLSGFALKGLGSAVLGIATGTLFGLVGDAPGGNVAMGGLVGGNLAGLLSATVGRAIALGILALMAAPAAVLAFALQKAAARPAAASRRPEPQAPAAGGLRRRILSGRPQDARNDDEADSWYPERRFDDDGNELPMRFDRERDVGSIRFVRSEDEDMGRNDVPAAEPVEGGAPEPAAAQGERGQDAGGTGMQDAAAASQSHDALEGEERLPTIPELLAGNHAGANRLHRDDPSGGPRETLEDPAEDDPIHVDSDGRPLPPTVRLERPVRSETPSPTTPSPGTSRAETQRTLAFVPADPVRRRPAADLLPGVRYADEAPAPADPPAEATRGPAEADPAEETPALSARLEAAVRGPDAGPQDAAQTARSIRETLRQKVEAIQAEGASNRYLAKLEALGIFEPTEPRAARPQEPGASRSPRQPSKRGDAKPAARKKAAKKKPAGKKAAASKPTQSKTATGKPGAKKKAAPRRTSAPKGTATRTTTAARTKTRPQAPAVRKAPARKATAPKGRKATRRPRAADGPQARRQAARLDSVRIERLDPLFARAMEAALERGAASAVLLTRRLGLPFARAQALLDRMVAAGALEAEGPRGSYRVTLTDAEWASLER